MPFTINGVGTSLCGAGDGIGDGSENAVEALVFLYLPIVPLKVVHVTAREGNQYSSIPLRWSTSIVLGSMVRRWLFGAVIVAVIISGVLIGESNDPSIPARILHAGVPITLGVIALVMLLCLNKFRRRAIAIRRLIGRHELGSSDPYHWQPEHLALLAPPSQSCQAVTYGDAAQKLLHQGDLRQAMFYARVSAAKEDRIRGEELTDMILANPGSAAMI